MYLAAPIRGRAEFGRLLNELKLDGAAVEVGTHRADFASTLLSTWRGRTLHCVDPWTVPAGYELQAQTLWNSEGREGDYRAAERRLRAEAPARYSLVRATSEDAVLRFKDGRLDFVYVDGDHSTEAVAFDLAAWWPKLRTGGLLAGHDWLCPGEIDGGWGRGIQRAVHAFAEGRRADVYMVQEDGGWPWSYYMVKHA